jgi:DNA polymerase-1
MSVRSRLALKDPPLLLIDGSAFIFRSFYAFRNMSRADGFPTNVLFMVVRLLLKLLREEKPDILVFLMDGKGATFRHELFPDYKSNRPPTPEPLVLQLAPLREALGFLGIQTLVSSGCEADDYIASLAWRFRERYPVVILGADKDLKQCLHENVALWDPSGKEDKLTTLTNFRAENNMEPASWPDFQALTGDSSDNIPGVPQIGPKSALGLIQEFKTLENLFANLPAVQPKLRVKLQGRQDEAMLYRELTRLRFDRCADIPENALRPEKPDLNRLLDFMARYELHSLVREIGSMARAGLLNQPGPSEEKSPYAAPPRRTRESPAAAGVASGSLSGPQNIRRDPEQKGDCSLPASEEENRQSQRASSSGEFPEGESFLPVDRTPEDARGFPKGDFFSPDLARAEYGNLLSLAAAPPEFVRIGSPEELSLAEDISALAIVRDRESGLVISAGNEERLYEGPMAALVGFAEKNPRLRLISPDWKSLIKSSPELEKLPPERFFDLSLAAYLLNPEERNYSFRHLVARFSEAAALSHAPDTHPGLCALALFALLDREIAGAGLIPVLNGIELPLIPVLAHMEERGIGIDREAFAVFLEDVRNELAAETRRIHALAGRSFNIRSSRQLSDVLFSVLSLPKSGKTQGGLASTSQESLEKLTGKHPIVEAVLEFRKLEKIRSTYLDPLPGLADQDGRIHTSFNQTATATGRLSSSGPNLQNIPIRGPLGQRMRDCFIAAPGNLLVCADYSQIELRVLAHLSNETTLLEAFRRGEDIHLRTAGLLFDLPDGQITPDLRRNAKTINFGLIYGMGAQKLARELHIGMKDADAFIKRYFARLGGLKKFYDSIEEEAAEKGFITTLAGRRRIICDIHSQNNQLKSQARRQAINTRIQGSAADIIKLAMLAVDADPVLKKLEARLLLQIHDELLLEVPQAHARQACERLSSLMSGVRPGGEALSVELLVESGTGHSWGQAH